MIIKTDKHYQQMLSINMLPPFLPTIRSLSTLDFINTRLRISSRKNRWPNMRDVNRGIPGREDFSCQSKTDAWSPGR